LLAQRAGFEVEHLLVAYDYETRRFEKIHDTPRPTGFQGRLREAIWTGVYWLGERFGRGTNMEVVLRKSRAVK